LGRLFFDTITFYPQALRYLINLVGADHVVLGTDAPFDMGDENPLETVGTIPSVTDEEREAILSKTACELLGVRTRGAV
jgi:aminocarboxymuconate-semialdehyde decarboxylase